MVHLKGPRKLLWFGIAWLVLVTAGTGKLMIYQNTPTDPGSSPERWPAASKLERAPGLPTLVMAAQPQCPCTRASIAELARIMARAQGRVTTHVVFLKSEAFDYKSGLWHDAQRIPGVVVRADQGGLETRRFRVGTSGQTLLYSSDGRLLFNGGVTGSRGHAGDNRGSDAILSLLLDGRSGASKTVVFGCSLLGPRSEEE